MSEPLTPAEILRIKVLRSEMNAGQIDARDWTQLTWEWLLRALDDLEALRKERQELYAANHTWDATCDDLRVNLAQVKAERDTLRAQLVRWKGMDHFARINECIYELTEENATLRVRCEQLENAVRNQRGDDLCWIQNPENAEIAKVLSESEFLESCRRYHAQLKSERGEFTGGRTIAQLEARCEQLKRENQALVHDAEAGPTR